MEDLFEEDHKGKGSQKVHQTIYLKFYQNGSTKLACKVKAEQGQDELWKIKKRLLKKMEFRNYKSTELQSQVRLFTIKGIELTEFDMQDLFQQQSLFYSLGDDFNYSVRIDALKFKKHLGKGGFGEVNMCQDELTGDEVAVKYLNFAHKQISN